MTYDKLEEMATIITQDTDGDGLIDQRGITDINNYYGFIRLLLLTAQAGCSRRWQMGICLQPRECD